MGRIETALGASISPECLLKEERYDIQDFGAAKETDGESHAVVNTKAVNSAIAYAAEHGGGTVVVPAGEFKVYTICLKSNVNLYLSEGAILRAARTDIIHSYERQEGEGGNYEEPEINRYAGLQDTGHSYFANSLIYGADLENLMIYGPGLIDGSCYGEDGYRRYVLMGGDQEESGMRNMPGHNGEWFGNKAIALLRCRNVVLKDFSLVIGGHFAVIAEGVINLLIEKVLIDTTRDALDIDCCQDVTVRDSTFNSLTDDALVMKASYGAGMFLPTKNVLIEDCVVSGYDAGSVYAGKYTRDKLIATDCCGPTGRVKFGTESTCGYDRVTIRRVKFDRSRGFAMEAVDGSDLSNVIFTDCTMDNVSSSPIFIRIGDRGRFPVTGMQTSEETMAKAPNVRLDNRNWILPDTENYQSYPAKRYTASYKKDRSVTVDGHSWFEVVDEKEPVRINEANLVCEGGNWYGKKYEKGKGYVIDQSKALTEQERLCRANASGSRRLAKIYNIEISNITITNADPRYPILLMGLVDSKIENVVLRNIKAVFRGGLSMEHAVEQRQLHTNWEYAQFETAPSVQTLPWLVNPFFLKEEGLLPRVDWEENAQKWKDDPYNVPELPAVYPEPSNWGILPAYGLYVRHADGLTIEGLSLSYEVEDSRHPIVLDDVSHAVIRELEAMTAKQDKVCETQDKAAAAAVSTVALVTNLYKRHTNKEYIPGEPYLETTVEEIEIPSGISTEFITVNAPAPGTPRDCLYQNPTLPVRENGYEYKIPTEEYPLPKTVHRPFFAMEPVYEGRIGEKNTISVVLRNPASEVSSKEPETKIYNESIRRKTFTVKAKQESAGVKITADGLPKGAEWNQETMQLVWKPEKEQAGTYLITLTADDGLIPERTKIEWRVRDED